MALRKIANLLKPDKEIVQDGDHMIIRTLSTFRNYIMDFQVGKEFEEDLTGIDDRKCMVRPREPLTIAYPGVLFQSPASSSGGSNDPVLGRTADPPSQPQDPRVGKSRSSNAGGWWWQQRRFQFSESPWYSGSTRCSDTRGSTKAHPNCAEIEAHLFYR